MAAPPGSTPDREARKADESGARASDAARRPAHDKRRLRRAAWALAIAAIAAAITAAVAVLGPPALRAAIIDEARARGVALDPGAIELGFGEVRLRRSRLSLLGVRGLSASVARATVALRGVSPEGLTAAEVDLALVGLDALDDLPAWAARYRARATELPLMATGVRIGWHARPGDPASLALRDASLTTTTAATPAAATAATPAAATGALPAEPPPWTGVLEGARLLAATTEVTRADVAWSIDAVGLSLGLGARDVPSAPVRVGLRAQPSPRASVELAVAPFSSLAALLGLGVDPRAPAMTIAGRIELRLPDGADRATAADGPLDGTFALSVGGFVLPHPRELDGLLFGDTTTVNAEARVSADRQRLTLTRVDVAAGALKLGGSGAIQREGVDATISMDLSGAVPCAQLAGSAVTTHLPGFLGALAGGVARRNLTGSVAVRVHVDARASRLAAARVEPTAVFRCSARF